MTRKFPFEIPHLKLSAQKSDHKSSKINSPPVPTTPPPQSIRPLSPQTTAELRSACAFIVQNYKPSHKQFDSQDKPRLEFVGPRPFARGKLDAVPLLGRPDIRSHAVVGNDVVSPPNEGWEERKYAYKPGVAAEDLFKGTIDPRDQARRNRIENGLLQHTADHSLSHAIGKPTIPPTAAIGSDSLRTSGSTPRTEITDYPWSEKEKVSTTMTSAVITPARTSKRASAQASQSNSELPSMPKLESIDLDWYREFDKKFKVIEDRTNTNEKSRPSEPHPNSSKSDLRSTAAVSEKVVSQPPQRRPVLPAQAQPQPQPQPPQPPQRTDSAQGLDFRLELEQSQRKAATPVQPERQRPRENSRASERKRSISQEVREYFRPDSSQASVHTGNAISRPASRARSFTQLVQEYIRPGSTTISRNGSVDLGRNRDRQGSVGTHRGENPDGSNRPLASTMNQRKPWTTTHRTRHDRSDSEASHSDSIDYQLQQPSVNLNRELPPLPGLDQWKESGNGDDSLDSNANQEIFIHWDPKPTKPMPRSILLPQSPPRVNSNKSSSSHYRATSIDTVPSASERLAEMNRQRAIGRPNRTGRTGGSSTPSPTSATSGHNHGGPISTPTTTTTAVPNSSPALPLEASQAKRKWWRPQTARTTTS